MNYKYINCLLLVSFANINLYAVRELYNEALIPVFVAGYHTSKKHGAKRVTDPVMIAPGRHVSLDVPKTKTFSSKKRYIIMALSSDDLTDTMTTQDIKGFPHRQIRYPALEHLKEFYFEEKDGRFKMLNKLEHSSFVKEVKAAATTVKKEITSSLIKKESLPEVKLNKYQAKVAKVRVNDALADGEQAFLKKRKVHVDQAIRKVFGVDIKPSRTPIISFVCSGGGYRAMLSTLGFMYGMNEIGIVDMTTYIASLSGSTWFLGTWLTSKKSLESFRHDLISRAVAKDLGSVNFKEMGLISDAYKVKLAYDEPITTVDLYGALLGNMLFAPLGDKRHQVYMSDQAGTIESGKWPFPIYTAVDGRKASHGQYGWYELTPFEVGGAWLGHYVPTWGFGRAYSQGKSITNDPEIPLGFLFGIFGSAFAVSVERIWEEMIRGKEVSDAINSMVKKIILNEIGDSRITTSEEHNFTIGMPTSRLRDEKYITMIDAGLDFNLPYPPVSGEKGRRYSDILIFFDASYSSALSNSESQEQLFFAETYARKNNLKFPHIHPFDTSTIAIFKDDNDPSVPLVIWMPLLDNQAELANLTKQAAFRRFAHLKGFSIAQCVQNDFCDTFNFKYKRAEAEKLVDISTFNVLAHRQEIYDAIKWKLSHMQ